MSLPTDLGPNDAGFLLHVVDFNHIVEWTGNAWTWAIGDEGNGFIRDFLVAPLVAGWQACDGTITSLLIVGHTTLFAQTITTPDEVTNAVYHKSAASVTDYAVKAAVAPLITGSTAAEASHTHSVVVPDQNTANESAHTHSIDPPATDSGDDSAQTTVDNTLLASTVSVAADPHHHTTDIAPFASAAGSAHHHDVPSQTFTSGAGSSHLHAHGTLVNDALGEPKHVDVLRYFRR